jgi:hypothetical protein
MNDNYDEVTTEAQLPKLFLLEMKDFGKALKIIQPSNSRSRCRFEAVDEDSTLRMQCEVQFGILNRASQSEASDTRDLTASRHSTISCVALGSFFKFLRLFLN